MRRYACHMLFVAPDRLLSRQVVEVGEDGFCAAYYMLGGEQPFTEWLGGIFVLLPAGACPSDRESLNEVWKRIPPNDGHNLVVWRVSGLSVQNPDPDSPCVWRKLF